MFLKRFGYPDWKEITMISKTMTLRPYSVFPVTIVLLCSICITMQAAPFECFAVSDLVRVFEDGHDFPESGSVIEVFGIRNEYVSAQCAVKANQVEALFQIEVYGRDIAGLCFQDKHSCTFLLDNFYREVY